MYPSDYIAERTGLLQVPGGFALYRRRHPHTRRAHRWQEMLRSYAPGHVIHVLDFTPEGRLQVNVMRGGCTARFWATNEFCLEVDSDAALREVVGHAAEGLAAAVDAEIRRQFLFPFMAPNVTVVPLDIPVDGGTVLTMDAVRRAMERVEGVILEPPIGPYHREPARDAEWIFRSARGAYGLGSFGAVVDVAAAAGADSPTAAVTRDGWRLAPGWSAP